MRAKEIKVSNGTLELSQEMISHLQLKDGESVRLETNSNGSVTIRKKETIADLKGLLTKGDNLDLYAHRAYQFDEPTEKREEL